jgi:hypothetical protein
MAVFWYCRFWFRHLPVGWSIGTLSAVLGSKWWLLIPAIMVLTVIFIAAMTFYPEGRSNSLPVCPHLEAIWDIGSGRTFRRTAHIDVTPKA